MLGQKALDGTGACDVALFNFTRHRSDLVEALLIIFERVRQDANATGQVALSLKGVSWLLLKAVRFLSRLSAPGGVAKGCSQCAQRFERGGVRHEFQASVLGAGGGVGTLLLRPTQGSQFMSGASCAM